MENSSLQIKNTQLHEQLERVKTQHREEQERNEKVYEKEKVTLLEQLSQIKQEKDVLTDKVGL